MGSISHHITPLVINSRGVPIIGSANISATDRAIFTILVIGTTITQLADMNTDYSACEILFYLMHTEKNVAIIFL